MSAAELSRSEQNYEFLKAVAAHDWETAEACLAAGADIEHHVSLQRQTPLLLSAARGDAEACAWLIEHGARTDVRNGIGSSLIHVAFQMEHRRKSDETLRTLLASGVPIDLPDDVGVRPLQMALSHRLGATLAQTLLELGADPNQASHLGATPLMVAATFGKTDLVLDLLRRGADPEREALDGKTLVHSIVEGNAPEMLPQVLPLLPRPLLNRPARSGTTPLGMAAHHGAVETMVALIENGADPNTRSANRMSDGMTPLMILAYHDQKGDGVQAALKAGARLEDTNDWDEGPLFMALVTQNARALELLVAAGANTAAPLDRTGASPYTVALVSARKEAQKEKQAAAKTAKELGASAPERSLDDFAAAAFAKQARQYRAWGFPLEPSALPGEIREEARLNPSPLAQAYLTQFWSAADELVCLGARIDAVDASGTTPLHALMQVDLSAAQAQALTLRKYQIQHNPSAGTQDSGASTLEEEHKKITDSVRQAQLSALERLDGQNYAVDVCDKKGRTAMAVAAQLGHDALVDALLARGASPLAATGEAETPLVCALVAGHARPFFSMWERIKDEPAAHSVLIQAAYASPDPTTRYRERQHFLDLVAVLGPGPWLEARDADGNTPLIVASATGEEDLVAVLLGMGADPNATNQSGETAMMHAAFQGKGDIIRALRGAGGRVDVRRASGESVTDLARSTRDTHVTRALEITPVPAPVAREIPEEVVSVQAAARARAPVTRRPRP